MKLKLTDTKAIFINVAETNQEEDISLSLDVSYSDDVPNSFYIDFTVVCVHRLKYLFHVVYRAKFDTDEVITSQFKESHFPKVNAPAIAYPFLRAFVANLMLNSGFDPLMLPTINFTTFKNGNGNDNP